MTERSEKGSIWLYARQQINIITWLLHFPIKHIFEVFFFHMNALGWVLNFAFSYSTCFFFLFLSSIFFFYFFRSKFLWTVPYKKTNIRQFLPKISECWLFVNEIRFMTRGLFQSFTTFLWIFFTHSSLANSKISSWQVVGIWSDCRHLWWLEPIVSIFSWL